MDEVADPRLSDRFARAFELALGVHREQSRKGGHIPYISHVMAVSALALENGADEAVAIAALLHDAIEDSDDGAAMRDRIEREFGPRVANIVEACSDCIPIPGQGKADWHQRKHKYLDHLEDADPDALLVALCDKVHNMHAIIGDFRSAGSGLWERFTTKNPDDQLWYYRSLVDIFHRRLPGPLFDEFERTVAELQRTAGSRSRPGSPARQ